MDALIPLVLTFGPEAAVSGPRPLQTDDLVLLGFNAVDWTVQPHRAIGRAVIGFTHPLASRFGYPNDEAQVYHRVLTG